jgi:hypothetical protein
MLKNVHFQALKRITFVTKNHFGLYKHKSYVTCHIHTYESMLHNDFECLVKYAKLATFFVKIEDEYALARK